jgi:hypothetical protein
VRAGNLAVTIILRFVGWSVHFDMINRPSDVRAGQPETTLGTTNTEEDRSRGSEWYALAERICEREENLIPLYVQGVGPGRRAQVSK